MRVGSLRATLLAVLLTAPIAAPAARAQSAANLRAIEGLAPAAALLGSEPGKAALAANLAITGAIQAGTRRLPGLLPFEEQRRLSIRDAFISNGNNAVVADGLGTRLSGAYATLAQYTDYRKFTSVSPAVAALFAYTNATTASDSNAGKYVLANGTTDGQAPASAATLAVLAGAGGTTDVFGKAYDRPAGSAGADPFGNSRPFQTLPNLGRFDGPDYLGKPTANTDLLVGPDTDLRDSPSFPSGHTTYGTQASLMLALLVPERYDTMVARAAEYGQSRVLIGAHYAMDVVAGRALAMHDLAHLLANDPRYVGAAKNGVVITDYPAALRAARADFRAALERACGDTIAVCARQDTGRFADPAAMQAMLDATRTYGLPAVDAAKGTGALDVQAAAPEAGHLLTAAFPHLSLKEANDVLGATARPGGGFLEGSALGPYARLDLFAASRRAMATMPR